MSRRPIRVRIEQLVLHGFDPRERGRVGEAIRAEIAAALAARAFDLPLHGASIERLDAGTVPLRSRRNGIGASVAAALEGVLRP